MDIMLAFREGLESSGCANALNDFKARNAPLLRANSAPCETWPTALQDPSLLKITAQESRHRH